RARSARPIRGRRLGPRSAPGRSGRGTAPGPSPAAASRAPPRPPAPAGSAGAAVSGSNVAVPPRVRPGRADVILLDLRLPDQSGLEVYRQRRVRLTRATPVQQRGGRRDPAGPGRAARTGACWASRSRWRWATALAYSSLIAQPLGRTALAAR